MPQAPVQPPTGSEIIHTVTARFYRCRVDRDVLERVAGVFEEGNPRRELRVSAVANSTRYAANSLAALQTAIVRSHGPSAPSRITAVQMEIRCARHTLRLEAEQGHATVAITGPDQVRTRGYDVVVADILSAAGGVTSRTRWTRLALGLSGAATGAAVGLAATASIPSAWAWAAMPILAVLLAGAGYRVGRYHERRDRTCLTLEHSSPRVVWWTELQPADWIQAALTVLGLVVTALTTFVE